MSIEWMRKNGRGLLITFVVLCYMNSVINLKGLCMVFLSVVWSGSLSSPGPSLHDIKNINPTGNSVARMVCGPNRHLRALMYWNGGDRELCYGASSLERCPMVFCVGPPIYCLYIWVTMTWSSWVASLSNCILRWKNEHSSVWVVGSTTMLQQALNSSREWARRSVGLFVQT